MIEIEVMDFELYTAKVLCEQTLRVDGQSSLIVIGTDEGRTFTPHPGHSPSGQMTMTDDADERVVPTLTYVLLVFRHLTSYAVQPTIND